MALDLSVIVDQTYLGEEPSNDPKNESYTYWDVQCDQEERLDGYQAGWYVARHISKYKVGTYAYYNEWRAAVCFYANNCTPSEVWDAMGGDTPPNPNWTLVELIHLSDCSAAVGPTTCGKIYGELLSLAQRYRHFGIADTTQGILRSFQTANRLNGFVIYH